MKTTTIKHIIVIHAIHFANIKDDGSSLKNITPLIFGSGSLSILLLWIPFKLSGFNIGLSSC
jgi:hypothetical protein